MLKLVFPKKPRIIRLKHECSKPQMKTALSNQTSRWKLFKPADGKRIVTPADGNCVVKPADGKRIVTPADGKRIVTPAEGKLHC